MEARNTILKIQSGISLFLGKRLHCTPHSSFLGMGKRFVDPSAPRSLVILTDMTGIASCCP